MIGEGESTSELKNVRIHIVSHTHWDREWYLPYQIFRMKLVNLMDRLLNILENGNSTSNFKHFLLDGQTIVLEDYLEIRPEKADLIKDYVEKGRISIGPWYVLPDEFLVSGESLIRNLMLGHKIANSHGGVMRVGYLPDPFGHIIEMPQILRGFDIDNIVFWRGYSADEKNKTEFIWKGRDGSGVLAINLPFGYCNAMNLTREKDFKRKIENISSALLPLATTRNLLLMNGCDHLFPEEKLPGYLAKTKENWGQSDLTQYVEEISKDKKKLKEVKGELRDCRRSPILSGVLSSRIYLKKRNHDCEATLEKFVEPLASLSYLLGMDYPQSLIWQAWKYLLQDQTHDGICGCSIDQVHKEMMIRYDWVEEISDSLVEESMRFIASKIKSEEKISFMSFNPLNWEVKDRIVFELKNPWKNFRIFDSDGKEMEFDYCDGKIALVDSIPSVGYKCYYLKKANEREELEEITNCIENEFLRVEINENGTINLMDKTSNRRYKEINLLVDCGDAGDEYNYSPPSSDGIFTNRDQRKAEIRIRKGRVASRIEAKFSLRLPVSLTKDRKKRKAKLVLCPTRVTYILFKGIPRVDVELSFENRAFDHRLRAVFPSNIDCKASHASSHFGVIERSVDATEYDDTWIEVPQPTKPQKNFVDVNNVKHGLMVSTRGLPEYEVKSNGEIYITLLRCVGWLSRNDLQTRKVGAGPSIETPGAQCIGDHKFEYSIIPHKGGWENAYLLAHQFDNSIKTIPIGYSEGELPRSFSFFELSGPLVNSSIKKCEKSGDLILRFYNPGNKKVKGKLKSYLKIKKAWSARLNEEKTGALDVDPDNSIRLEVNPYQIFTARLELDRQL